MFAIPGIIGLLFFIYLRPQEAYPPLQGIPFLYLFFGLILFGAAVDLRLRITKAIATPSLPWALGVLLWSLLTVAITRPDQLIEHTMALLITVAIFILIAQSIQTFRVFEKISVTMVLITMALTVIALHQSLAPTQCVIAPQGEGNHNETGTPDGRLCESRWECYEGDDSPSEDFMCEKVGWLGTHSISGRVRYRGILQDPNELAAALSSGLALLLALWLRTRRRKWAILAFFGCILVAWAIKETGSRSGQLGLLAALGTFLLWKYGPKLAALAIPAAVPILLLLAKGGSGRGDATESSAERFEAWRTGLDLFQSSPVWGVGYGQFTEYHFLTAHNTYILVLAELGFVGAFLFSMLVWISMKTPLIAFRRYRERPEAEVAEVWSIAILASMSAIICGALFLSLTYHYMLWIFLGLGGALYVCIKRHDPEFQVQVGLVDVIGVLAVDFMLFVMLQMYLRLKGF